MATREIARERWSSELDAFSSHHAGWIVTLEVLGREFGEQPRPTGSRSRASWSSRVSPPPGSKSWWGAGGTRT
jgi:hypothetical protein